MRSRSKSMMVTVTQYSANNIHFKSIRGEFTYRSTEDALRYLMWLIKHGYKVEVGDEHVEQVVESVPLSVPTRREDS